MYDRRASPLHLTGQERQAILIQRAYRGWRAREKVLFEAVGESLVVPFEVAGVVLAAVRAAVSDVLDFNDVFEPVKEMVSVRNPSDGSVFGESIFSRKDVASSTLGRLLALRRRVVKEQRKINIWEVEEHQNLPSCLDTASETLEARRRRAPDLQRAQIERREVIKMSTSIEPFDAVIAGLVPDSTSRRFSQESRKLGAASEKRRFDQALEKAEKERDRAVIQRREDRQALEMGAREVRSCEEMREVETLMQNAGLREKKSCQIEMEKKFRVLTERDKSRLVMKKRFGRVIVVGNDFRGTDTEESLSCSTTIDESYDQEQSSTDTQSRSVVHLYPHPPQSLGPVCRARQASLFVKAEVQRKKARLKQALESLKNEESERDRNPRPGSTSRHIFARTTFSANREKDERAVERAMQLEETELAEQARRWTEVRLSHSRRLIGTRKRIEEATRGFCFKNEVKRKPGYARDASSLLSRFLSALGQALVQHVLQPRIVSEVRLRRALKVAQNVALSVCIAQEARSCGHQAGLKAVDALGEFAQIFEIKVGGRLEKILGGSSKLQERGTEINWERVAVMLCSEIRDSLVEMEKTEYCFYKSAQ